MTGRDYNAAFSRLSPDARQRFDAFLEAAEAGEPLPCPWPGCGTVLAAAVDDEAADAVLAHVGAHGTTP